MVHNVRRFFHVIINRQRSCGAAAAFVVAQINDCRVKLFICCNLSAPRWMKEHLCCSFGLMRHTWAGVHRCFSGLTFPNYSQGHVWKCRITSYYVDKSCIFLLFSSLMFTAGVSQMMLCELVPTGLQHHTNISLAEKLLWFLSFLAIQT